MPFSSASACSAVSQAKPAVSMRWTWPRCTSTAGPATPTGRPGRQWSSVERSSSPDTRIRPGSTRQSQPVCGDDGLVHILFRQGIDQAIEAVPLDLLREAAGAGVHLYDGGGRHVVG